ncbi:MAG: 50S ribosomal protein L4 [Pseudomonadota bacterium]
MPVLAIDSGTASGNVAVADEVFAQDYNEPLIHQVVTAYMAQARTGSKKQKTRSEVAGGGAKPWRQKGTGRARAGTIRSPLWRGGGRAFAARPRSFEQKVNRKMYRGAMRSIMSELARQDRLVVVDAFELSEPKTKLAAEALGRLDARDALIVAEDVSDNLFLAVRNLPHVGIVETSLIDPVILLGYDKVVITKAALEKIGEMLK